MPEMNIIVRDKIATKTDNVIYVCGNSDYVVNFDFDSEWDAYDTKTAQFNVNGKHIPVVFTGNQCKVPIITNTYAFHVGVFAGDLHTTTAARVPCKKSILCDSGAPADPPDDVYNQIMEKLDKMESGTCTLPVASPTQLGGVKPVAKTDAMTRSIGVDGNGGLYTEPAEVYYIDLEGNYPNYTCPVALADIKAAYEAGKVLECRCAMGQYTATLPLFIPMPSANTWIFSGSGALTAMNFSAQSLTIAIANNTVKAESTLLARMNDKLPNPYALNINSGSDSVYYDGSEGMTVNIPTMPTALKNPNALTITIGDNVVSYDGSAARAITIPASGGSGGETWELINTFEIAEADAARVIKIDKDSNGNAFSLKEFAFSAKTNSTKTDGNVSGWFCVNGKGTYNSGLGGFQTNYVRHPSSGAAIVNDVIGRALPCGLVYDHSTNRKAPEGIQNSTVTDVHEVELAGYQYTENLLYGTFSLWGVRK